MNSGHYFSFVKHGSQWYKYDDSKCFEIAESNIKTKNAYILFYLRKGFSENYYLQRLREMFFEEEKKDIKRVNSFRFHHTDVEGIENYKIKSVNLKEKLNYSHTFANLQNEDEEQYFPGEPLNTPYGRGYFVEDYSIGSERFIKVKMKYGYAEIRSFLII